MNEKLLRVFGAIIFSNKFSTDSFKVDYLLNSSFINSTKLRLLNISNTPSHPISKKSQLLSNFLIVISGSQVITYSSAGLFKSLLYSKSPIALDKFKLALTLPS